MSLLSSVVASGVDERVRKQASSSSTTGPADGVRADFRKKYSYFPAVGKPVIGGDQWSGSRTWPGHRAVLRLRFASDAAKFSTAFARRGLIAEYGLAWILPRLVGHANALDLLFSARMVDSAEALRMGLVNQVFPQDVFLSKVNEFAREVASNSSPRSTRIMKRQVYDAMFQRLAKHLM